MNTNGQKVKRLLFFTNSYPYGLGMLWKSHELKYLVDHFDRITVVPFTAAGNFDHPVALPPGVECEQPLFPEHSLLLSPASIFRIFDRNVFFSLREFLRSRVYQSKAKFIAWLVSTIQTQNLLRHPTIRRLMQECDDSTVLYYYWGKGSCNMVPFLTHRAKAVVRMHGYDLFEDRNGGYIPYRRPLLEKATLIAPSSEAGAKYLKRLYPDIKTPIAALRCGVLRKGDSLMSEDGVLRLMSCSFLLPVKRVSRIVEALMRIEIPVVWTHVGDGPLMSELQMMCKSLPRNVNVNWVGRVKPEEVLDWYVGRPVDLFINVSESEGAPFSIMEAFSASVPVMATDVGGTSELVDNSVGCLLPRDVNPQRLADLITNFSTMSCETKLEMRKAARNRFLEMFNASVVANEFAKWLSE